MPTSPEILVFGANPAWQKTLTFPRLTPGAVNRAVSLDAYAAGKGVNFCRAAAGHGRCRTLLFQFSGGENGARHEAALRDEGICFHRIRTAAETRCCLTCLDRTTGEMTELIEPSSPVTPEEATAMTAAFSRSLADATGAAIVGSLPDGTDPNLYCDIIRLIREKGVPVLIDAAANIVPALDLAEKFILKINRRELQNLTGGTSPAAALSTARDRWPGAIFVIFALFAFFGIGPSENNDWRVAPIIVSVSVGSAVYWFLVTALLAHFRKKFKLRTIIWINRIAGAVIVVLGLALLGEGLFRVLFQGYPLI